MLFRLFLVFNFIGLMKPFFTSISITIVLIGAALLFTQEKGIDLGRSNVSVVNGQQIIEVAAKGGYSPSKTLAQAGLPTILRVETTNTFDCSSALTISDLDYTTYLSPTGMTEIEIPAQEPGTMLQGLCAMGMYNFEIEFN